METQAVIYCRVSSERQVTEGGGIDSQRQRCLGYALNKGYSVVATFADEAVSGAILNRPGIRKLLGFLESQNQKTVVIIDDISRIARDVKTHIDLRAAIQLAGGILESPSMRFDETAAGEMVELVLAAAAQFGRKGNREQVLNRQRSRLEMGYWTFPAPIGYRFEKRPPHNKILVPDQLARTVLRGGLEAFATGRLRTNRELALYLKENGFFPDKDVPITVLEKRITRVFDALPLYAGFIEYPSWGVQRVEAKHEAIISHQTLRQIESRFLSPVIKDGGERADASSQFILRNFVRCPECGKPYTGCLAKGKYPRYLCYNQGACSRYGHSISAKIIEPAFKELLKHMEPKEEVIEVIKILSTAAWKRHVSEWSNKAKLADSSVERITEEISAAVKRLTKTDDDDIASEIENTIKELKVKKAKYLSDQATFHSAPPDYEKAFESVSTLFRDPYTYWDNGSDKQKRTVHRVVFTVPPAFDRNMGFSTYDLTLPYRISTTYAASSSCLVEVAGVTPASSAPSSAVLHAQMCAVRLRNATHQGCETAHR